MKVWLQPEQNPSRCWLFWLPPCFTAALDVCIYRKMEVTLQFFYRLSRKDNAINNINNLSIKY